MDLNKAAADIKKGITSSDTVVAVFKNNLVNARHALKNGKNCMFLGGEFTTSNRAEIEELMEEIAAGHPHIYLDPECLVKETKFVDPLEAIRASIIAELKASGQLIAEGAANFGTSEAGKLNVATTRDVAEAMSGSTSVDGGASASSAPATSGAKIVAGPISK